MRHAIKGDLDPENATLASSIATKELTDTKEESDSEVAPKGCYVARYQVRQRQKVYWYYKLQATDEIFEQTKDRKKK